MRVGEPPVVEDLEEDVPDRLRGLLELVEQHHAEGVAPNRGDEAGAVPVECRVRQQPLQRLGCLELAHVEADEPVGRPEQELGEGLRDLGLAGAGRPQEEEDAERPRRVRQPRLDHRHAVDDTADRVGLLEDARLEERPHILETQGHVGVEKRERQARRRGERREDVARVEPLLSRVLGIERGRTDQAEHAARRRDAGHELLGEVVRADQRVVVGRDAETVVLERMACDLDGLGLVESPQLDHVECARHPRPGCPQQLECGRRDLGDDRDRAGLDVGQQRVEQPVRAAAVLPREQRLLELGQNPDHVASPHRPGELLHPGFQLPDEHGARKHLRRGRLEHDRSVEAVERGAEDGRLASAVLADDQHGPPGRLVERGQRVLDDLGPAAHQERRRHVIGALPDTSDATEQLECPPLLERFPHLVAHVGSPSIEVPRDGVGLPDRQMPEERARIHGLPVCDPTADELDDVLGLDPVGARQDPADRRWRSVPGESPQLEGVLAVGVARKAAEARVGPFCRDVVAACQRREGDRCGPTVGMAREIDHLGDRSLLAREALDRGREPRIELERVRRHHHPLAALFERLGVCVRALDGVLRQVVVLPRSLGLSVAAIPCRERLGGGPRQDDQGEQPDECQGADDQVEDVHPPRTVPLAPPTVKGTSVLRSVVREHPSGSASARSER